MQQYVIAATQTDGGRVRERNEDAGFASIPQPDMALLIVADGMGGYRAGEQASAIAVNTIREILEHLFSIGPSSSMAAKSSKNDEPVERTTIELPETIASDHYGAFLTQAIRHANQAIITYGRKHHEARGLGSTVTVAVLARNRAYFANVGDSRAYLFRQGTLRAITRDHSLVARLVEAGQLEPDAVYAHPKRNLIYRSLGSEIEQGDIDVDIFEEELEPNDVILLCSDGLWEKVRTPEMTEILLNSKDLNAICTNLITLANENGGEDNI
jgi:serine/threonine protein phosphatase PrpC